MTVPLLTSAHLNRALLARQFLLERAPLDPSSALEQVAGLQTQDAPSAYIGLWARLSRFERCHLTQALEDRSIVQASLMRHTIHAVSRLDYALLAAGVRRARREWWLRVSRKRGLHEYDYQLLADKLRASLGDGPLTKDDLQGEVQRSGYPRHAFEGVVLWLDVVRVPPSGTWERPLADLFGLAADWLDRPDLDDIDESAGLDHLLQRYLRAFGPAPLVDVASWAGVPIAWLRPASERLDLRVFRSEAGEELLDVVSGPIPDPDTPSPVRFLPTWDATLLVHARRAGVLAEEHRSLVFGTGRPHSVGVVLVDGRVAAIWRWHDGGLDVTELSPIDSRRRGELDSEAERLAAFHQ